MSEVEDTDSEENLDQESTAQDILDFLNTNPYEYNSEDLNVSLANEEEHAFQSSKPNFYLKKTFDDLFNDRYTQNTKMRKKLARWAMWVVSLWMATVLVILVFNEKWLICLSTPVLITLLTTTTANVLGLVAIVLYDLFGGKSESRD